MKSLFIFGILLIAQTSFANGNRVGNGGDIITCSSQKPVLLDFYETSRLINEGSGTYQEILKKLFTRLEEKHSGLGKQYLKRSESILPEIEWSEKPLKDIQDSEELVSLSKDCQMNQAAIRKTEKSPLTKSFLIQKKIWNSLSETQKAGLISHEIIYEHFSKLGEKNSRKARELNALLFSEDFEKTTGKTLRKVLEKFEIPVE